MRNIVHNQRRWLAALTLWLATLFIGHAETVTGRFQYLDFDPAAGTSRLEPIRFCRVEVWSHRPRPPFGIWTWGNDAGTNTDGNGRISVPFNFQTAGVTYGVRITAENYAAIVWPNSTLPTSQFYNEPGEPDGAKFQRVANNPGDVLDFSYDFTDTWTPQHWSMAEAMRHGFDFVSARRDPLEVDLIPKTGVQPGFLPTFYNQVQQSISVNSGLVWEDYTMVHEYAHFLEHQIGSFAPIPSSHDGCAARDVLGAIINSAEHAWMEGFAEFFAMAVATNLPPGTLQGAPGGMGTMSIQLLEDTPWTISACTSLPANVTPDMIENVVAGVLWDLADGIGACGAASSEAHDNLSGFATQIIQIMDREMDVPYWPSIADFRAAWITRGLPLTAFLDILAQHGLAAPVTSTFACPANITATAPANQCRALVSFTPPTLTPARRCATVQCDYPASGWGFDLGTTTVNCSASEAGTVIGNCSFTVTVNPAGSIPNPNGTGLLGVYYDDMNLLEPRAARTEAVDFDWGLGSPAPGVDADTFSVRWSGQLVPRFTGTYTLYTVSDDGVRLWVYGELMIDNWTDHAATEDSRTVFLEAGRHYEIVMETYENAGGAVAKLLWSSNPCQAKEIIPATHLLPAQLECPSESRPTYPRDLNPRFPRFILFGEALIDAGWLKLTLANGSHGIAYVDNFSGARPVFGFEASFKAALFGSLCCGNGAFPADGFSFNLVPEATALPNPGYNEPAEEGLDQGLAICFDTWDNGGGEAPAIEAKWLGQVIARVPFQPSQSPAGIITASAAARDVNLKMTSDGKLTLSYGGVLIFNHVQTPYSPNVIGIPRWVLGARNGGANDNHWIRDLRITVNPPNIGNLFNTGVDNDGRPLADNTPDLHYGLIPPGAFVGTPLTATSTGGYPIGPWLPDNSSSAWIAPTDSTDGLGNAFYVYQTTFDLNGLNPSEAVVQGWVASDDVLMDILINGISTGQGTAAGFAHWQAFTISSGIQSGANTLIFVLYNSAAGALNPTGLRVQMCGWAWTAPQLKLDILHQPLVTTVSWGSLPHKTYFLEHAPDAAGPWTREPNAIIPGNYRAHFDDLQRLFLGPTRIYRVFEAMP